MSRDIVEQLRNFARGRELDILINVAGIPSELLDGKHHPCPLCGGKDRFRLIAPNDGAVYCNQCFNSENGDFIAAVQHFRNVDFNESIRIISEYLGEPSKPAKHQNEIKKTCSPKGEKAWVYQNEKGEPVYRVVRIDNGAGDKKIFQERYENGNWIKGMTGIELLPFQFPEIIKRSNETIFIAEGEKCCDILTAWGLLATTASGGTNNKLVWSKYLKNRDVVILPDNDKTGYDYADKTATTLYKTNRVKIVTLPNLPEKGDIADWAETGNTKESFLSLVDSTPIWDGIFPKTPKDKTKINSEKETSETPPIQFECSIPNIDDKTLLSVLDKTEPFNWESLGQDRITEKIYILNYIQLVNDGG